MNSGKHKCMVCGQPFCDEPLMVLEDMPSSAQDIPDAIQVKADQGITLELCQCMNCGLVQFDCEPVAYYRDVIRSGGFSTTMVELRRQQYDHVIKKYGLEGKKVIEVGCGRGEFLSVLGQFPVDGYGIEHKSDLVELARSEGLRVWEGFTETADTCLKETQGQPPYDVFLSFNFFEHQPDPGTMLQCIYNNLTEDGVGLITVPSLEYILEHDGYYELIRDHLAYYTFETLGYVLEQNGFSVLEQTMVNRDTLSMVVRKVPRFGKEKDSARKIGTAKPVKPVDVSGLKASRVYISEEVNHLVKRLHGEGKTLALWGAGHQGFTLAATTKLGEKVEYIIDSAPFKQGRFAPASHIPIVSPEDARRHPVDTILIVAPGYTEEISKIIRNDYNDLVQILVLRSNHIEEV